MDRHIRLAAGASVESRGITGRALRSEGSMFFNMDFWKCVPLQKQLETINVLPFRVKT